MSTPKLLIVYATTHGQTEKIANRMAEVARAEGLFTNVVSVEESHDYPFEMYQSLMVAGSIHFGRHQRKLEDFIKRKLSMISSMKSALVSVSGAAATARGKEQAEEYVHALSRRTGWVPEVFITIAGAEPYTRYGLLTGIFMRAIARKHGRTIDVRKDYEFTDWDAVDGFVRQFIGYCHAQVA